MTPLYVLFLARVRSLRLCHGLALGFLFAPGLLFAVGATGVGFQAIGVQDPVNGGTMPGYVFYPSAPAKGMSRIGPYDVAATLDAAADPGEKPLIVISHGNAGSNLGHHDLATYLAGHSFIVATLEHPKDNFHDTSGVGKAVVLAGRPIQVKAVISYLLDDASWKKRIDAQRIGVAGFSAGGYTSLLVAGGVPRFRRFIDYCHRYPADALCADADRLTAEAASRGQTIEQVMDDLQQNLTHWGDPADPRVKAAFAMAPLSLVFDVAGAAAIDRPVFLYYGQNDHVLRPSENAEHLRPLIKHLVGVKAIANADHWVFIPPCSAELARAQAVICSDPPGIDRARVHAQIQADALAFFRKTLGVAVH